MRGKEKYFTSGSIEHQAAELLQQVRILVKGKEIQFRAQESALLILDMQAFFLEASSHAYVPSAQAIVGGLVQLVEAYSSNGRPVVFTQHVNSPSDAGMMATWWKEVISAEHPLKGIAKEFDLSKGVLVQKSQYDAFHHTPLDELLRARGIRQLVVCGVMTHLCCETTARSAFMRGYEVLFPVDGTATYTLEHHRASLLNLAHGFATIVLVQDILAAVRGEHGG